MTTIYIELELQFADRTTEKLTVGPFPTGSSAAANLKANVKAFNAKYTGNSDYQAPAWLNLICNSAGEQLLVGNNEGYPQSPIKNATIITSDETAIEIQR